MIVLKIVGYIAGGLAAVLLIVLVLAFLLLLPRIGMDLHAQDGTFTAKIRYGWIYKTISLPKGKKNRPKQKSEETVQTGRRNIEQIGNGKGYPLQTGFGRCDV